ncbi:MAG TPA: RnfABCDGE type electron transport complex subunit D [Blastocatellia bacterium]|jgi:Na+-translocating ferredoxin:NAD+ oxidoreductase RnfD subunit|nr:RnfABCDGE type electron transport complex subunit D [Blastocatellia bacterium]
MNPAYSSPASTSTGQGPEGTVSGSAGGRRFRYDSRFTAPLFITLILLVGQLSFGILESYYKTALAIGTAILVEVVLARVFTGKWPHLASAYISGISVGILVRSPAVWPYALCSAISITSKYVLRVKGRHIWNPSNFGICAMLFLASDSVASLSVQWGNFVWPMLVVWALGSLIIWRLKRFHICATYVLSFLFFSFLRSWLAGHPFLAEVAPITGPMYQLFVFFMITDPKTTVKSKLGQCVVAFSVALVEMILRLNENVHAPYYALFIVGPIANLIEIWWTSRRSSGTVEPALTAARNNG